MEFLNFIEFHSELIECEDQRGYTLLSLATHYGRVKMVKILLENGATPNTYNKRKEGKNTPLHLAVRFKFKKIVDLLLNAGADEKALNANEKEPWE